jgi:hypothetical protein
MSRHKKYWIAACSVVVSALVPAVILSGSASAQEDGAKDWAMNNTIIGGLQLPDVLPVLLQCGAGGSSCPWC